jgi:hypothetical protein
MALAGIDGIDSDCICLQLYKVWYVTFATGSIRQRVYVVGARARCTPSSSDILLIGDSLDKELSAVGLVEEFGALGHQTCQHVSLQLSIAETLTWMTTGSTAAETVVARATAVAAIEVMPLIVQLSLQPRKRRKASIKKSKALRNVVVGGRKTTLESKGWLLRDTNECGRRSDVKSTDY